MALILPNFNVTLRNKHNEHFLKYITQFTKLSASQHSEKPTCAPMN